MVVRGLFATPRLPSLRKFHLGVLIHGNTGTWKVPEWVSPLQSLVITKGLENKLDAYHVMGMIATCRKLSKFVYRSIWTDVEPILDFTIHRHRNNLKKIHISSGTTGVVGLHSDPNKDLSTTYPNYNLPDCHPVYSMSILSSISLSSS
jgi:hypothetical protein